MSIFGHLNGPFNIAFDLILACTKIFSNFRTSWRPVFIAICQNMPIALYRDMGRVCLGRAAVAAGALSKTELNTYLNTVRRQHC